MRSPQGPWRLIVLVILHAGAHHFACHKGSIERTTSNTLVMLPMPPGPGSMYLVHFQLTIPPLFNFGCRLF